jgi:subtilisin-like proprotein convertase family protein
VRARLGTLASLGAIALAALVLAAPAATKTKTKTFQNATPVPIPQAINPPPVLGEAVSDVAVSKKGTVKDVNVGVQITDDNTENLILYLFKGERFIWLSGANGRGPSDNDFGGGTGCVGAMTVFDDSAAEFIFQGSNPFAGSFRPAPPAALGSGSLAEFKGEKLNGTWRLLVQNVTPAPPIETGTIQCVQIAAKYKVAI